MADEMVRSVPVSVVIKAGKDLISTKEFLIYPGTETIYGQVIDLAVTEALKLASEKAWDLIEAAGDSAPEALKIEAAYGKAGFK